MITALKTFYKQKEGATVLEFAFVAPVLFLTCIGLFELGLVMFYTTALEGATNFGARVGRVDFSQTENSRDGYIISQIRAQLKGVVPLDSKDGEAFSIKVYDSYDNIGKPEPCKAGPGMCSASSAPGTFTDTNGNGVWDADQGRSGSGGQGDIVQYQVIYKYHFFTPLLGHFFPNPLVLKGITVVRNEPA